MCVAFLVDTAS